jgi:hypothetical protein
MKPSLQVRTAATVLAALVLAGAAAADVDSLLGRIKTVGREGAGSDEAARAWRELVRAGPEALPATLAALDDVDPAAANWLRSAVDAIAERELTAGRNLPVAELEAFARDTRHTGRARRLAYEWLVRADAGAPARLLPGMLHDPSPELRRDAVARALDEADAVRERDHKAAAYRKALSGATDLDQVETCARQLKALGVDVDLPAHFGLVRRWSLIAPFDNRGEAGYARRFPPETKVDLAATCKGKEDTEARWTEYATNDPHGVVDLNKVLGRQKGTLAYAFAAVVAPVERPVQVRVGCINAVRVFLNGKEVLGREEYHHGMYLDQYVGAGTLKAGRNELLVKICQNEQKEEWAQEWKFQLRLCDVAGAAVPFTVAEDSPPGHKEHKGETK